MDFRKITLGHNIEIEEGDGMQNKIKGHKLAIAPVKGHDGLNTSFSGDTLAPSSWLVIANSCFPSASGQVKVS